LKIKRYRDHIRKKKHIKKPFRKFNYSEIFSNTSLEIPSKKLIDVFSWVGLKIENEHSITIVSDLSGSINGMEVRSPYLNKPLLEFSANLPLSYKIKSYFFKAENKYILKRYLENYLPKSLIYTKKMGFGFGISYKTFIHDYKDYFDFYFKNFLPKVNLYDSEKVYKLYLDHKKGVADNSDELINILIVLIWYEKFIN
jgi:asparagine synthase (glutamine-hydrolysing)